MFKGLWHGLTVAGNWVGSFILLLIRLYWGFQLVVTGFGKFTHLSGVTDYFHTLGISHPELNAIFAASTELIGGLFLIVGFLSRIITIPLFVLFAMAYWTAGHAALVALGKFDPGPFMSNTAFLFLYAVLVVFSFGPGKISLDNWLTGANKTKTMP